MHAIWFGLDRLINLKSDPIQWFSQKDIQFIEKYLSFLDQFMFLFELV
jgi:hypothetical protein